MKKPLPIVRVTRTLMKITFLQLLLAGIVSGLSFASPRGSFALDAATQAPRHHIYLREVQLVDGAPHNVVLEDLGEVVDPGDDSQG